MPSSMLDIAAAELRNGWLCIKTEIFQAADFLKDFKPGKYDIAGHREKRSLDANAYCWKLCELMAEKLRSTKEEVYQDHVKLVGPHRLWEPLPPEQAQCLITAWKQLGLGWQAEILDWDATGEKQIVCCYYGSSQYNTKQMSRLIDSLVQDAQAMGIETYEDEKINSLIKEWEANEEKRRFK